MRKSYWIWLVLFFGMIVMAIVTSAGNMLWYLSLPALIMIVAPSLFLSLSCFQLREIGSYFRAAFSGSDDKKLLENALLFFDSLKRYFVLSGVIGGFCGAVAMLISDESVSAAFGAALVALTVLYGVIAWAAVGQPFAIGIRRRLIDLEIAQ